MSKMNYASTIGYIMYATICTRPHVSYALSKTRRQQSDHGEGHWTPVKNILKYLRRTKDSFLDYGAQEKLIVKGYTDDSFQIDKDDSMPQFGYVFCLNGGVVNWKISKQKTDVGSTTEVEYIVASNVAKEVACIRKFIIELDIVPSIVNLVHLYCDDNGAILQAKKPISHQYPNIYFGASILLERSSTQEM